MVLVDTNVLVHAYNADSPTRDIAADVLQALANGSEDWYLSWGIVYEFLRVSTHPRVFRNPASLAQANGFVRDLLDSPMCHSIAQTPAHGLYLTRSLEETPRLSGNILHDFHTAVLMREHGIGDIFTFDRDFLTFPWVTMRPIEASI